MESTYMSLTVGNSATISHVFRSVLVTEPSTRVITQEAHIFRFCFLFPIQCILVGLILSLGFRIEIPTADVIFESCLVPGNGVRFLRLWVHKRSITLEFRKVFILAKVEVKV